MLYADLIWGLSEAMNTAMFQIILTSVFAAAALANYVVLQSIKLGVSELNSNLREWSRQNFAEKEHVNSVQAHLLSVDRRVQIIERILPVKS
jgi:hypothetical protein